MPVPSGSHFRLWRFALRRLRYLCFDIFLRRFFTNDPMQKPQIRKGGRSYGAVISGLGQTHPVIETHKGHIRTFASQFANGSTDSAIPSASARPNTVSIR